MNPDRVVVIQTCAELSGLFLSCATLEAVLDHVSGRAVSLENILLSILFAAGGSLWINADRSPLGALRGPDKLSSAR